VAATATVEARQVDTAIEVFLAEHPADSADEILERVAERVGEDISQFEIVGIIAFRLKDRL